MSKAERRRGSAEDALSHLPFVRWGDKGKREFWCVKPTGEWIADCAIGDAYAEWMLLSVPASELPRLLGWIVMSMISDGQHDGVVVGFMGTVGRAAAKGRTPLAGVDPPAGSAKAVAPSTEARP